MPTIIDRWGTHGPRPAPDPAFDALLGAMTAEADVRVECGVAEAWELISDVTRIGEFSPECVAAAWLPGAPPRTVGARFEGTNRATRDGRTREWTRPCEVVASEPERLFAYSVGDRFDGTPASRWEFALAADGASTVIHQRFAHLPGGQTGVRTAVEADPGHAAEIVALRQAELESAMRQTLERMRSVLEGETPGILEA